jgi:CRISPR-associated protein Cas2
MTSRLNAYRIMWIFVLFDLPVVETAQRKVAAKFRNDLLKDGFEMLQYSVYYRHVASREQGEVHIRRAKQALPEEGKVNILMVTDKQFGLMEVFYGSMPIDGKKRPEQLELF